MHLASWVTRYKFSLSLALAMLAGTPLAQAAVGDEMAPAPMCTVPAEIPISNPSLTCAPAATLVLSAAIQQTCTNYARSHNSTNNGGPHTYSCSAASSVLSCSPSNPAVGSGYVGGSGANVSFAMTAQDNTNGVTWSGSWNGPNCNCSGNSTITADAECKCPPGKKWAPQANTCVPTVDKEETRKELYCPACPTAEAPPPTEDGFGNPIFPLTGAKREFQRTGISIGGIELRLTYDTTQRLPSDVSSAPDLLREPNSFGVLWKSNLHHTLQVATNLKGAMLTRGNGLVINFTGNGSGAFTPDTGNAHKLVSISGGYRFTDDITGAIETFDSNGKLTSLAAADGNVLTFTYSGGNLTMVQAADGRLVRFTYNGSNLITQLVGTDAGSITVAYDGANNLTSLTWQDGKVLTFVYGESGAPAWALTGKVDENSSRLATFGYDAQGRATSTEYAGVVNKYSVIYSSAPIRTYTEVYNATDQVIYRTWRWQLPSGVSLTRPNGESSSIEVVDAAGTPAISSMNQSAGSGSTAATMATVYDSQGNKVTQDNYQGERTCRVFDSNRREIVRVEGLANTVACSSVTPHGAALPAGARKYTTTWHADWRLPTKRVGPLSQTTHIYQGQPDPFNSNVAAN